MENEIVGKQCSKCKIVKSITEFHKNKCFLDGLNNQCKPCRKSNPNYIKEIPCECGKIILNSYLKKHLQTNYHIKRMNNL